MLWSAWMSKATAPRPRSGSASAVSCQGVVELVDGGPQLRGLGPQLGQQPPEDGRFLAGRVEEIRGSEEFRFHRRFTQLSRSIHMSRCDFVQSLPRAGRILDLGGTNLWSEDGALVHMGYPYEFEELMIVELPEDDRHPIYRTGQ